jgi:osmotically-inducible protein OsmY
VAPATVVTAQRSAEDQAITVAVIDRIVADERISGRVGVDTYRNVVTLSGRVATPLQADRAARHALRTPGVREVDNQLRAHPGA